MEAAMVQEVLPAEQGIYVVTYGVRTLCVNVWEETFVHACKGKIYGVWRAAACIVGSVYGTWQRD